MLRFQREMISGRGKSMAVSHGAMGAAPDFRVFSTDGQIPNVRFYFIESTAPDNVEQGADAGGKPPDGLIAVDPDEAVKEIAATLTPENDPGIDANLVVMVHGFNTPRARALDFYGKALAALRSDKDKLFGDPARRTVCVGYRWPSERIGSVLGSSLSALPALPLIILCVSALAIAVAVWVTAALFKLMGMTETNFVGQALVALVAISLLLIFVIVILALLRAIVYFRDVYRATNYGVPDLVEVIRQIDRETVQRLKGFPEASPRPRAALSFIGHSMGGLIVTNAIRVLSDVFSQDVIRTTLSGRLRPETAARERAGEDDEVSGRVGHVFTLMRFVLVSPDIPAEALLADRANFLASALRRFREAYLFSSEGDEVLRAISTSVNYFTFPTMRRIYGYRLGNAEILASAFGATSPGRDQLDLLRTGTKSLKFLSGQTTRAQRPAAVARAFTFFDCTDYKDGDPPKGLLTEALDVKRNDPNASIPLWRQLKLLILYALGKVDVHGGYFDGAVTQRLIYRLGCLGFDNSLKAYGDEDAMLAECAEHQIRVMPSDRLHPRMRRPREPMNLADSGPPHAA
jgi:hypothetical protein